MKNLAAVAASTPLSGVVKVTSTCGQCVFVFSRCAGLVSQKPSRSMSQAQHRRHGQVTPGPALCTLQTLQLKCALKHHLVLIPDRDAVY